MTENGVAGTGSPTKNFGDGWYALGVDPTGNPSNGQVFWLTFFRLFGDTDGNGVVTGPYTTLGTDAYNVYHSEGQSGPLLSTDVDGNGVVNSKDYSETVLAKGDSVGSTLPINFPQFQIFAGAPAQANAIALTQAQVQALLPLAVEGWIAAGLDSADVRELETVQVQVADLGSSILGLEAANTILINQTAAGSNWYLGTGSNSSRAFGLSRPGGEGQAGPDSPASGEVDLLTVLEHELGHIIGLADDATAGDLMDITLEAGVRRTPSAADVAMAEHFQLAAIATTSQATVPDGSKTTVATPTISTSPVPVAAFPAGPGSVTPALAESISDLALVERPGLSSSPSVGLAAQAMVEAALASLLSSQDVGSDDEIPLTREENPPTPAVIRLPAFGVTTTAKGRIPQLPMPSTTRLIPSRAIGKNVRPVQSLSQESEA